jgi:prevent-host-death family protein
MKVVALREAKQQLSATVDECQDKRVLITRYGKPAAILIGVEGLDFEEVMLQLNPRFWEMITESRHAAERFSIDDVRKRYKAAAKKRSKKTPKRR